MARLLSPPHLLIITAVTVVSFWQPQRLYGGIFTPKQNTHSKGNIRDAAIIEERSTCAEYASTTKCIWIDGYPVSITPRTSLYIAPTSTTFRYWPMSGSKINVHAKLAGKPRRVYGTKEEIQPNSWILYDATLSTSRGVTARKALLWPNRIDRHEQDFLNLFACNVQPPDFTKHIDGSIKFRHEAVIQVVSDHFIQEFIGKLIDSLASSSENRSSTQDQIQPRLQAYVVRSFSPKNPDLFVDINGDKPEFGSFSGERLRYDAPQPGAMVRDIIAMPNGVILIPDVALANLKNQAQLTALLDYAVASIRQKEGYRAWPIITSPRARRRIAFDSDPAFIRAFGEWQTQQVLRIGIREMYFAGYDIREAPFAWAVAQGKPVNNPVIDSKDPDKEIPWYAAYAFNYISQYYKDADYTKLKRGEAEYAAFLQELRKADPAAFAASK